MRPVISLLATLAAFGVAFTLLHWLILWLGLPDLAALMLFALPVVVYIAWCTADSKTPILRTVTRMHLSFAGVILAAAGLVLWIG